MTLSIADEIRRIFAEGAELLRGRPAFNVTAHVGRSAEVVAYKINDVRASARPYAIMEEAAIERMQTRGCL